MVEVAAAPPGCIFFQLRERSPIIPLHRAKPMPVDRNDPNRELYSIAVVTVDESSFPEMRRALATSFRTTLASTEEQIKALVEDPNLHGILFDLDSVGEGARDGIDVLKEIRAIREDVVLVAMTGSQDRSIPLRASQASADQVLLAPVNQAQPELGFSPAVPKTAPPLKICSTD